MKKATYEVEILGGERDGCGHFYDRCICPQLPLDEVTA